MKVNWNKGIIQLSISQKKIRNFVFWLEKNGPLIVVITLTAVSVISFFVFYFNGLGIAYNDARSHLNIGRRVVEGLSPGLAQLGSVWLPLLHAMMIPTVWNDFMWHSGLSGALPSMVSFVFTGAIIYQFLKKIKVGLWGRFFGVFIFIANLNVLYLQSTAMTELLLLATMTAGVYELFCWYQEPVRLLPLIKSAVYIMMGTLIRYDAWFLLFFIVLLLLVDFYFKKVNVRVFKQGIKSFLVGQIRATYFCQQMLASRKEFKFTEGLLLFFVTLAGFGIFLWFLWNLLIFKDPFYFAFGPFSAYSQQKLLESAGNLATKGNLLLSFKFYIYALAYNQGAFTAVLGFFGFLLLLLEKSAQKGLKVASLALVAPFAFNVIALFWGHSVLYIQGLSGNTWFNVRYGIMMAPSIAVFIGFLIDRLKRFRPILLGMFFLVIFFSFINYDAVAIDDALHGASQKNVTEVSSWLRENAQDWGYILISAASHDAIVFSSGLPMKRFIHEGTGKYWETAALTPSKLARWVIMRTHDETDLTFKAMKASGELSKYRLVDQYPFADIYQLKDEYLSDLLPSIDLVKN